MKLTQAQVQNFRCVDDSGEFTIDENITCLVGKNESGKTTLLTALYRLNPMFDGAKFDRQKEYPRRYLSDYAERHEGEDPTVITTWWTLEQNDKSQITEKFGPNALKSDDIKVEKGYSNKWTWVVEIDEPAIVQHLIETSGLHDEEKEHIGVVIVKKVAELRAKVAAFPEASPRQTQLIQRIDQDLPEASAWRGQTAENTKFQPVKLQTLKRSSQAAGF
jgi:AAA15 family ATPase/GTPase